MTVPQSCTVETCMALNLMCVDGDSVEADDDSYLNHERRIVAVQWSMMVKEEGWQIASIHGIGERELCAASYRST